jgi:hypothetical protein
MAGTTHTLDRPGHAAALPFSTELIDTTKLDCASPAVASYIQQQYDRHMPTAQVVLGQFADRMEFYNLAYW